MQNEVVFQNIKEQINSESKRIIADKLEKKQYNHQEAQTWTNTICDMILKYLTGFNQNFKYIVNAMIMQRAECGLSISGSCYWDNEIDGSLTIKWENQNIICIVNIFGCGI